MIEPGINDSLVDFKRLFETASSPLDYTNSIYLYYIELLRITEFVDQLVFKNLDDSEFKGIISKTQHSYLIHASIQDIPNIIRDFGENNIAVYQVIKLAKIRAIA